MNDFREDLKYSLDPQKDKIFEDFYFSRWDQIDKIEKIKELGLQLLGVDRIITLKNGKKIYIDEKVRRKDYGDILIEEYSDFEKRKKGWLSEDNLTDYIAYLIEPSMKIYFFPFQLLVSTMRRHYHGWLKKYGRKISPNGSYNTSNMPIPTDILLNALQQEIVIQL